MYHIRSVFDRIDRFMMYFRWPRSKQAGHLKTQVRYTIAEKDESGDYISPRDMSSQVKGSIVCDVKMNILSVYFVVLKLV